MNTLGRNTQILLSSIAIFLLGPWTVASGCIHMDTRYDRSKFKETAREALMWRDLSDPRMVNLVLKSGAKGEMPPDMAWVFPLPSVPVEYKETEGDIFGELDKSFGDFAILGIRGGRDGMIAKGVALQGIIVHEKEVVGDYEIVPIEIVDETSGGQELNHWLDSQGYATVGEELQAPYLKKGACFLAVKVKPKSESVELKPLLIRYPSKEIKFPLRFSHDDRAFDFNLYLVGEDGMNVAGVPDGVGDILTQELDEALGVCPSLADLISEGGGRSITRVALRGANSEFMIRDLSEDPGI